MKTAMLFAAFFYCLIALAKGNPTTPPSPSSPQPAYHQTVQTAAPSSYVPHVTYPYSDGYGPLQPYEGYLYPGPSFAAAPQASYYMSSLFPAAQYAFQIALRVFAKVGLFLFGGVTLLVIGGLFTTAVCSLTPICTLTFNGFGQIDKDTMRALMTPEKISTAAALVQDAIGKYQRLQRAVNK